MTGIFNKKKNYSDEEIRILLAVGKIIRTFNLSTTKLNLFGCKNFVTKNQTIKGTGA